MAEITRIPNIQQRHNACLMSEVMFLAMVLPSMYQCAQLCYSHLVCKAFCYRKKKSRCDMFLTTIGKMGLYVSPDLTVYVERSGIPKEIVGSCAEHNCDRLSMCQEIKRQATCIEVFEDVKCFYPLPIPIVNTTLESPVIPGTHVRAECNSPLHGSVLIICGVHGQWKYYYNPFMCKPDFCDAVKIVYPDFISGIKEISTKDGRLKKFQVYCDTASDNSSWLVIQRRTDMTFNFNNRFDLYLDGFGSLDQNYWIGINNIFLLTDYCDVELRVEFKVANDVTLFYAMYGLFKVGAGDTDFLLSIGQYSDGNCGDGLSYLDNITFNVTTDGSGGWWLYDRCNGTNLNADDKSTALQWTRDCSVNNSTHFTDITFTRMMIRRK